MTDETRSITQRLDAVKRQTSTGIEYWHARDLIPIMGYDRWDRFKSVIERASAACDSAGQSPQNHFRRVANMVSIGSGARRERGDYQLSRYACYLIAMAGDTNKPEIGIAQTYFAVQTRRMEVQDQAVEDQRRVQLRARVRTGNKKLNEAAQQAGVQHYGLFHDAGYRGLYNLGLRDIKTRKGLKKGEDLLDRAGRTELAANEFRITQPEQKLVREGICGQRKAMETHHTVAAKVRDTIKEIGGTLPEDLPPEPPIEQIENRMKARKLGKPETK